MLKVSLRNLVVNKLRLALTLAAVIVGVAFVSGTFVLSDTMVKAFDELYTGLSSGTDVVVKSKAAYEADIATTGGQVRPLDEGLVETLRDVEGVEVAEGSVFGFALLLAMLPVQAWVAGRAELIPPRPGLVTFPLRLGDWQGVPGSVDDQTLAILAADDYVLADYTAPGQPGGINLWVAYYGSQIEQGRIHSPKECLPGAGWEFSRIESVPAPATPNC